MQDRSPPTRRKPLDAQPDHTWVNCVDFAMSAIDPLPYLERSYQTRPKRRQDANRRHPRDPGSPHRRPPPWHLRAGGNRPQHQKRTSGGARSRATVTPVALPCAILQQGLREPCFHDYLLVRPQVGHAGVWIDDKPLDPPAFVKCPSNPQHAIFIRSACDDSALHAELYYCQLELPRSVPHEVRPKPTMRS